MSRKLCQALPLGLLLAAALLFTPNVLSLLGSDTYTLTIEAVGSGTTSPSPGVYTYTSGQEVTVEAIPDEGYIFYQWELDGQRLGRGSPLIEVEVNKNHVLRALFVKKELVEPLKGTQSPGEGDTGIDIKSGVSAERGWNLTSNLSLVAEEVDLEFNDDVLSIFSLEGGGPVLYLGGPVVIPFDWDKYGVRFGTCHFTYQGEDYRASFGERDYAVILVDAENGQVRIAGITRYGTRAGLLWFLGNYDYVAGNDIVVLEWIDFNENGKVDLWEISAILTG